MTLEVVQYKTDHGDVSLDVAQVKRLFCPLATDVEATMFLKTCLYQNLNPFLKEVYLIKYDANRPATMVIGKDAFTKRASRRPEFNGYDAGIVVQRGGNEPVDMDGSLPLSDDKLIGGWARVYRKDWARPVLIRVSLAEYNAGQASWRQMPATMIRKVALVQALREAFPDTFQGLYDESEMGQAISPLEPRDSRLPEKAPTELCPLHNIPWLPAGISRKAGKAYPSFHKLPYGSFCHKPPVDISEATEMQPEASDAQTPAPTTALPPQAAPMPPERPSAPREEAGEPAHWPELWTWAAQSPRKLTKAQCREILGIKDESEWKGRSLFEARDKILAYVKAKE